MFWKAFSSANLITTFHDMQFKGVLIGLAVREFDGMCAIWLVFQCCQKVVLSKNRSYEVFTRERNIIEMVLLSTYNLCLVEK